jgi:hypothetical protein
MTRRRKLGLLSNVLTSNNLRSLTIDFSTMADGAYSGTWSISSGKLINTPVLGDELIVNGNMETGDPPTGWTAIGSVLSAQADERTGGSGTKCLRVANSGAAYGKGRRGFTTTLGAIAYLKGWLKKGTVSASLDIAGAAGGQIQYETAGVWTERKMCWRITVGAGAQVGCNNASSIDGGYSHHDDVSVQYHTLAECIKGWRVSGATTVRAKLTIPLGSWGGVVHKLDSDTNPQNFILAYHDRTNAYLLTYIGGTWNQLVGAAAAYGDGRIIEIRQTAPTTYQLWYNGAQVGTDQTIDNAALNNNQYGGLFATYGGVAFENFFMGA